MSELQSWWQNLNPEIRGYALDGGLVLGALLGGHIVGVIVARMLRNRRFDSLFRVMPPAPDYLEDGRGFTPTMLAGLLVRLTVWAGAGWWLARQHGQTELAGTLSRIIGQTWAVAGILMAALVLAGLLARRVIECLDSCAPATPATAGRGAAHSTRSMAGAAGAGIYGLVLILTLLAVADYFNWPLTRTAAVSLWQLALNLLIAGAALLVGGLGARWARALSAPHADASAHDRVGQYTSIGIVAGTTALAVGLLLFTAGLSVGVAAVAIACLVLFFAQGHFADLIAGLRLRKDKVDTVWKDGIAWQINRIGLLRSEVGRGGEYFKVQNRHLLEATAQGAPQTAHSGVVTR